MLQAGCDSQASMVILGLSRDLWLPAGLRSFGKLRMTGQARDDRRNGARIERRARFARFSLWFVGLGYRWASAE